MKAIQNKWNGLAFTPLDADKARSKARKYVGYFKQNPQNTRKLILKFMLCVAIIDGLLLLNFSRKLLTPQTQAESSSANLYYLSHLEEKGSILPAPKELGIQTNNLLTILGKEAFAPTLGSTIENEKLSVPGNMIILDDNGIKNNISVFEYADVSTAQKEANDYANLYNANPEKYLWKSSTYVYSKDTLVILYLGTNENIIGSLNLFAGDSLVK
ncbi:MAG: hypothetical protein M3Q34_02625 [bacterium]|nr:hypothetical protein [bacterium]